MEEVSCYKGVPTDLIDQVPSGLPFFYYPEFVARNGEDGLVTYILKRSNQILAFIHFKIQGQEANSLPLSSFGGLVNAAHASGEELEQLMAYAVDNLRQDEIRTITIRECPVSYNYQSHKERIYKSIRFDVMFTESNQYMVVEKPFSELINRNRKRSLKKAQGLGFTFQKLKQEYLKDAHALLAVNRQARDLTITMSLEQLRKAFVQFPDRYLLFGLLNQDKLIAASVCIKVNNRILYDFYHGELPEYTESSPVTMLLAEIYQYALSKKFEIIDLGISSVEGEIDEGLFQFKRSLGARVEEKNMYQLML